MPAYDADAASIDKPVLTPGRPITVWDADASPAEDVGVGDASQQISLHRNQNHAHCLSVQLEFAADPGEFQVDLQTADEDADKYYVTKASLTRTISNDSPPVDTNPLNSSFVGRIEAANIVAKFARLKMITLENAVAVTAKIF